MAKFEAQTREQKKALDAIGSVKTQRCDTLSRLTEDDHGNVLEFELDELGEREDTADSDLSDELMNRRGF